MPRAPKPRSPMPLVTHMSATAQRAEWDAVLAFWFREEISWEIFAESHRDHCMWRMSAAKDNQMVAISSGLNGVGRRSQMGHWLIDPHDQFALTVVVDQFSRSLWRNTPLALGRDTAANSQVCAFSNGHYEARSTPSFWWFVVSLDDLKRNLVGAREGQSVGDGSCLCRVGRCGTPAASLSALQYAT